MGKAFDISKFRKSITKSIDGLGQALMIQLTGSVQGTML